jgi:phage terminase small subunit
LSEEIQEKPVKKLRRPTLKQEEFAREYVANGGNGTQAALKTYDVDTNETANAIAVENLQKPLIKELVNGFKRETVELHDRAFKKAITIAETWLNEDNNRKEGMKYLLEVAKVLAPSQKPPSKVNNLNLFKMPKRD